MKKIQVFWGAIACAMLPVLSHATTIAQWDFEQGTPGGAISLEPVPDVSGNGNTMFGFNETFGPYYSAVGETASGLGLSSSHTPNQDGYTAGAPVNTWTPLQWTIEVSVKLDNVGGWNTIIGKDGSTAGSPPSDFYIQNNGIDDRLRLDFATLSNERVTIDSDFVPLAGQWYGFAGVSDGTTVTLYADKLDGNGYLPVGNAAFAVGGDANNALANGSGSNWTFGRGWYNGGFADHIDGNLDNIRFSDVALTPSEFLAVIPEPGASVLLGLGLLLAAARRARRR